MVESCAVYGHTELRPYGKKSINDDLHSSEGTNALLISQLAYPGSRRPIGEFIAHLILVNARLDCSDELLDWSFGDNTNGAREAMKVLDQILDFMLKHCNAIEGLTEDFLNMRLQLPVNGADDVGKSQENVQMSLSDALMPSSCQQVL